MNVQVLVDTHQTPYIPSIVPTLKVQVDHTEETCVSIEASDDCDHIEVKMTPKDFTVFLAILNAKWNKLMAEGYV